MLDYNVIVLFGVRLAVLERWLSYRVRLQCFSITIIIVTFIITTGPPGASMPFARSLGAV